MIIVLLLLLLFVFVISMIVAILRSNNFLSLMLSVILIFISTFFWVQTSDSMVLAANQQYAKLAFNVGGHIWWGFLGFMAIAAGIFSFIQIWRKR